MAKSVALDDEGKRRWGYGVGGEEIWFGSCGIALDQGMSEQIKQVPSLYTCSSQRKLEHPLCLLRGLKYGIVSVNDLLRCSRMESLGGWGDMIWGWNYDMSHPPPPEKWPQRPILLCSSPESGMRIRGVRYSSSEILYLATGSSWWCAKISEPAG